MNKELVKYPYNRTQLSNEKKKTTDTYRNIDEFQNGTLNEKNAETKDFTLYDSIYVKF